MKKYAGKHNNNLASARWLILACLCCTPLFAVAAVEGSQQPLAESAVPAAAPDASIAPADSNSPAAAISAYKPALPSAAKTSTTSQLANLIGGLTLILALIYGLSWFVKRFSQGGFMQNASIKMLASLPLGTRERLMLVEVGGKQILLGVTAAQINSLHVFDEPAVQSPAKQSDKSAVPTTSDFSQKLMAILQQKPSGTNDASPHKNIK